MSGLSRRARRKPGLLAVLNHPELPLHNNAAELAVRARVRKRDVSFGPRTTKGVKAWDTGMTLVETARKLGVSFYHYIRDRISGAMQMPSLAAIIKTKTDQLHLGASWNRS
jgi:hypothetical protein